VGVHYARAQLANGLDEPRDSERVPAVRCEREIAQANLRYGKVAMLETRKRRSDIGICQRFGEPLKMGTAGVTHQ
jgi:hypothetical protein